MTAFGNRRNPGRVAAWRVVAGGLAATLLFGCYVAWWERRGLIDECRQLASERIELLASTLRVSMQVLDSLQSLHAATGGIEPAAFTRLRATPASAIPNCRPWSGRRGCWPANARPSNDACGANWIRPSASAT